MSNPAAREFRFGLRALFSAITLAGLFLALDRATVGTSLNVSLRDRTGGCLDLDRGGCRKRDRAKRLATKRRPIDLAYLAISTQLDLLGACAKLRILTEQFGAGAWGAMTQPAVRLLFCPWLRCEPIMPISVVCPGCKARFSVSEKFAGKKGPCPKCKQVITIPDAPAEEIKIHVPEQFASGGKDTKGRAVLKPIERVETKVKPVLVAIIVGSTVMALLIAVALRFAGLGNDPIVVAVGLAIISAPLAVAAYTFLRDDELEPYRGRSLWIRAGLCGLAYALLWGLYWPLPAYGIITGEMWQWVFVAPAFIAVGAAAAWATLDLDFASGAMHYCFFLLVSLLLRFVLGMPPIWEVPGGATALGG